MCCSSTSIYLIVTNSNCNWTFIVLNLPYSMGTVRHNKTKSVNPISVSRDRKKTKHHRERPEVSKIKVGMPWWTGRVLVVF